VGAGLPFEMALLAVYMGMTEYLMDMYDSVGWGAGVIAAGRVVRASFEGCFLLFGQSRWTFLRALTRSDV